MSKYIVHLNGDNASIMADNIKEIAKAYWIDRNAIALIEVEKRYEIGELRDKIKGQCKGSVSVIEIMTTGTAAVSGIYGVEKTWNYIQKYCTSDIDEVKKNTIKQYEQEKETINTIPNAEINDNELGLGL